MRIDILTIFPEMFSSILSSSILGRAASKGILEFKTHNIRDFSQNKHRNTDDYPFGGGAGMVMLAQPIFDCIESVAAEAPEKPRCTVNEYMINVMHEEPVDPSLLDFDDSMGW